MKSFIDFFNESVDSIKTGFIKITEDAFNKSITIPGLDADADILRQAYVAPKSIDSTIELNRVINEMIISKQKWDLQKIKDIVAKGADISKYNCAPFWLAVYYCQPEVVSYIGGIVGKGVFKTFVIEPYLDDFIYGLVIQNLTNKEINKSDSLAMVKYIGSKVKVPEHLDLFSIINELVGKNEIETASIIVENIGIPSNKTANQLMTSFVNQDGTVDLSGTRLELAKKIASRGAGSKVASTRINTNMIAGALNDKLKLSKEQIEKAISGFKEAGIQLEFNNTSVYA